MAEMQAFYDAITPRAEEAISYCDKFTLDDMPEDVLNLMHLLYSMIMVSFPVECWKQPRVPDSGRRHAGLRVRAGPVTDRPSCGPRAGPTSTPGEVHSPAVIVDRRQPHRSGQSR